MVRGPLCPSLLGHSDQPSLCKACSTHKVLLCILPPKQKGSSSTNCRPRPSAPQEFNPANEPPSYLPPHQPSLSPSSNSPAGPETSPDSLSPLPSPPATRSWSVPNTFPLREVAGPEGPTRVHVPFSLSDMSQIEEQLGSFSENPTRYRKEFLRLSQAYNLTWSKVYYILNATLTRDEKNHIW